MWQHVLPTEVRGIFHTTTLQSFLLWGYGALLGIAGFHRVLSCFERYSTRFKERIVIPSPRGFHGVACNLQPFERVRVNVTLLYPQKTPYPCKSTFFSEVLSCGLELNPVRSSLNHFPLGNTPHYLLYYQTTRPVLSPKTYQKETQYWRDTPGFTREIKTECLRDLPYSQGNHPQSSRFPSE